MREILFRGKRIDNGECEHRGKDREFVCPKGVSCKIPKLPKGNIELVQVVRCKDCIHWYEPEGVCLKIYSDGAVSPYAWQDRNPEDFCSYGERKTNEAL